MHEIHLARSLLNAAIKEAQHRTAKRIKSVTVTIGRFSVVSPESLRFCFEQLSRETIAQGAKLEIQSDSPAASCPACKTIVEPIDHDFFCPNCGEPRGETMAEQDIEIDYLEVEF